MIGKKLTLWLRLALEARLKAPTMPTNKVHKMKTLKVPIMTYGLNTESLDKELKCLPDVFCGSRRATLANRSRFSKGERVSIVPLGDRFLDPFCDEGLGNKEIILQPEKGTFFTTV